MDNTPCFTLVSGKGADGLFSDNRLVSCTKMSSQEIVDLVDLHSPEEGRRWIKVMTVPMALAEKEKRRLEAEASRAPKKRGRPRKKTIVTAV